MKSLMALLLVLATLTSTISLHEVVTAYMSEAHHMSRKKAAVWVTTGCVVLGTVCSLSMGVLSDYKLGGMNIFDFHLNCSKHLQTICLYHHFQNAIRHSIHNVCGKKS